MHVVDRFFDPPKGSFFLFGPRGTGKSTWLSRRFPNARRIDLLDADALRRYAAHPETLAEEVRALPARTTVLVDEVQKAPDLLPVVHALLEEDKGRQFVLTGSSARKLKRTGADLLAGRAILRRMHPFLASELGKAFRLEAALERGLLPVVLGAENPAETLRTYVSLCVREEVLAEGLVRNLGSFARSLEALSFSHAHPLNVSNVARECQAGRMAVEGHVRILEDLLLAFQVPVFSRRARREVTAHPKFFFADAGIFRSLRPQGPLDRREEIDGQALEGLVAQHLRAWIDYRGRRNDLHFWRTRGGSEADLVVYGEDGLVGIEVKNRERVQPQDLRGLEAFLDEFPSGQALLLHRGRERRRIGRILCLPCADFLLRLRPDRTLAEAAGRE